MKNKGKLGKVIPKKDKFTISLNIPYRDKIWCHYANSSAFSNPYPGVVFRVSYINFSPRYKFIDRVSHASAIFVAVGLVFGLY